MVDEELMRAQYPSLTFNGIVDALKLLADLGVWQLQVEHNTRRLCEGFNNVDSEELAKQILQVQQTNRNLLALHELGSIEKKGINDA